MKKLIVIALVLIALCLMLAAPALADEATKTAKAEATARVEVKKAEIPAGQQVFMDAKCSMCHTVYSAGIGEPPAEGEKKDEGGPPDLSMVGVDKTAEWLKGFLKKEVTLHDKKHMMMFKGEDKDLDTLVQWLLTLKPEEKAKDGKAKAAEAPKADAKAAPQGDDKAAPAGDDKGDDKAAPAGDDKGDDKAAPAGDDANKKGN
jgi:mono/diheme cytochrome c family protein